MTKTYAIPTTNGGRTGRVIHSLHLCHPSLLLLADNEPISIGSWSRVTRSVPFGIENRKGFRNGEILDMKGLREIYFPPLCLWHFMDLYSCFSYSRRLFYSSLVHIAFNAEPCKYLLSCNCLVFLCLCPLHTKKSSNSLLGLLGSYLHDDCQFRIPC